VKVNTSPGQTAHQPTPVPRSLEVLAEHVRTSEFCPHRKAGPGKPCKRQGRRGVHLARFVHAYVLHLITPREIALVIGDHDVVTAATIIRTAR
jgi:hypothetical protein